MEGPKEGSGMERSSTSRPLNGGAVITVSLKEEELDEDEKRNLHTKLKTDVRPNQGEVSLREWLDKPGRPVDFLECLHIFRQVVQSVNLAHCQGVVVNNIRPSCFVMSTTFNSVSFIESASCSGSDSDFSCGEDGGSRCGTKNPLTYGKGMPTLAKELDRIREVAEMSAVEDRSDFPLKKLLSMESNWYRSPEEVLERQSLFESDVYKLGVLLFELFCMFETMEEKLGIMSNLRHRVLPPQMLLKWPKVASFCLWLLHPQPCNRPKMRDVLQSEFLNEKRDSLEEREVAIKLNEEIEASTVLLEFLLQMQRTKQETANMLHDTSCLLSRDIEEVSSQRSIITNNGCFIVVDKTKCSLPSSETDDDYSASSGSRKRVRVDCNKLTDCKLDSSLCINSLSEVDQEKVLARSSRIKDNFKKLEAAYFSTRCKPTKPVTKVPNRNHLVTNTSRGSTDKTQASSVDDFVYKEAQSEHRMGEWINPFLQGLCKYLSFSKFRVCTELKQGDLLNSSNLICSLAFDRDKQFFATVGVNKKIKVFECDSIMNDDCDIHYPMIELTSKAKLSNVCWNSYIKCQIASSDFEGVVQVWDVTRSQVNIEMREHEKRVWSVDYSLTDPTMLASGSDDGTVKLWNINQRESTCTLRTKANVCSVQFSPDTCRTIAVGSADHNVYCYDLRNVRLPLCTLVGHAKTVSYVKFVDSSSIVSSSTDSTIKLWDLSMSTSRVVDSPIQTFTGHTNVKNFVGLSISDGYIATGSETNEVFVYQKAFPMPVLTYKFDCIDPISGLQDIDTNQFISSVCWRGQSSTLVAANSSGNVKILEMV